MLHRSAAITLGAIALSVVGAGVADAGSAGGGQVGTGPGTTTRFLADTGVAPAAGRVPGELSGVAATSAAAAWAVGSTSPDGDPTHGEALVMRWNGTVWTQLPSPSTPGSSLSAVAARSANDAWAVGAVSGKTLILHWNGATWTRVPSPAPGVSALEGVTALSPRNAWAVGSQTTPSFAQKMLILHWNGSVWKRVRTPRLPAHFEGFLRAVAAKSAHSVWAVGSMTNCGCGPGLSLIVHWNGHVWKLQKGPITTSGYTLGGVAAISSRRAWAVGTTGEGDSPEKAKISRFDGRRWRAVHTPSPGTSARHSTVQLAGVTTTSSRNAWAVGGTDRGSGSLIERWNGHSWKRVPTTITLPSPAPAHQDFLAAVAATSSGNAWAVGQVFVPASQTFLSVVLHWNGTAWR